VCVCDLYYTNPVEKQKPLPPPPPVRSENPAESTKENGRNMKKNEVSLLNHPQNNVW